MHTANKKELLFSIFASWQHVQTLETAEGADLRYACRECATAVMAVVDADGVLHIACTVWVGQKLDCACIDLSTCQIFPVWQLATHPSSASLTLDTSRGIAVTSTSQHGMFVAVAAAYNLWC